MNFYDLAYSSALVLSAPLWLTRGASRRKVANALRERMGTMPDRPDDSEAILIHAVSLGEVNATRALLGALEKARPDLRFIVSATTDTGFARAIDLYGGHPRVSVIRYPLDFSSAIRRVLDRLRPRAVALMELELWPNFLRQCRKRGIPVIVLNGRLTEKSFRNYRRGRFLLRGMFAGLTRICAQEEAYAGRFIELGADPDRVEVTGTMKFDTAPAGQRVEGDAELAADLGLDPAGGPIWVCGSTGPGEEAIVLDIYSHLREKFPALRLAIIPRKPERFDETARLIESRGLPLIRRSRAKSERAAALEGRSPVILGDTLGELRKFYSLATVIFVGRTLVDLGPRQHGSDMIEPAALGKPVVVGPFTGNFAEPMRHFRVAEAMVEVNSPDELEECIGRWLGEAAKAVELGGRARKVVQTQRGATQRNARAVLDAMRGDALAPAGGMKAC